MAIFNSNIIVGKTEAEQIKKYLNGEEYLSENEKMGYTISFENGAEMDIAVLGVEYIDGDDNGAWTDAMLFKGNNVCYADSQEDFFGEWEIEFDGDIYRVNVIEEKERS